MFTAKITSDAASRLITSLGISSRMKTQSSNPDRKVYKTYVVLDDSSPELRPNMSADVTIIIKEYDDVLSIPLIALQRQGVVFYVWVRTKNGPEARQVKIGDHSLTRLIIEEARSSVDRPAA